MCELIKALIGRLEKINYNNHLVSQLISGKKFCTKAEPLQGQSTAISMSLTNPITIIWGPPGTGKTHTLAEIALKFFEQGKRVLILSQSNIAVDNAMLKIKQFVRERRKASSVEGEIFRAGYSKIKEVFSVSDDNDFYINARQYVEKNNPDVIRRLTLCTESREKETNPQKKKALTNEIRQIRNSIHEQESQMIVSARILGTTISKATVDEAISHNNYDVVLFDEASMAYVPQIVYACSLAKQHFVCIGDFRQLPPIVQCSEENVLNKDIFEFLGIFEDAKFSNHQWLVMLNEQRRMHPTISGFVKSKIYFQLLKDHCETYHNRQNIIDKGPLRGSSLGYFDVDQIGCSAQSKEVGKTFSHSNFVSAYISVLIALSAKKEGQNTVAIISPYKNQVNLVKAILRDLHIGQDNGVHCSTIHQFQGRECDVVIFDTVDASPMKNVGLILSKGDNSKRLVNVAMTRAEGKFILVGSAGLARECGILSELWQYVTEIGKAIELKAVIKEDLHPKVRRYHFAVSVVTEIYNREESLLASFNNSLLKTNVGFFDILNRVPLTKKDRVFIDKTIENTKLDGVIAQITKVVKQKIGYKSLSFCADNLFILDNAQVIFPVFSTQDDTFVYFHHIGKHTVNTLMDLQFEQLLEESKLTAEIQPTKTINPNKWVKCPVCGICLMHEGEEMCSVCAAPHKGKGRVVIAEQDKVTLREICDLWGRILGKRRLDWFWDENRNSLNKVIHNNPRIEHVFESARWDASVKVFYYNRNDVFREFFCVEKRVGHAISTCRITSYAELEYRCMVVAANMHRS